MRIFQNMKKVAVMASIVLILSSCGSGTKQSQSSSYKTTTSAKSKTSTKLNFRNVSFNEAVAMAKKEDKPIFIDFYATWCGPCQQMKPHVDKLNKEGYSIESVDIDVNPTLAESANVRGVPTIAIYENGKLVESIVGYQDKDLLQKKIDVYKK